MQMVEEVIIEGDIKMMKYKQFKNLLTITILFRQEPYSSPNYMLEKIKRYLGKIEIKKDVLIQMTTITNYNKMWSNENSEIDSIHEYLNSFVNLSYTSPLKLIYLFNKYIIAEDIPTDYSGGLHPVLKSGGFDLYMKIFENEIKDMKRLELLNDAIK